MGIEDLKNRLDNGFEPVVCEVTGGEIRRYVQAIGDADPRWQAEAPPGFILVIGFDRILHLLLDAAPESTILHGSTDAEYYLPVAAGDVITGDIKVTGIRERKGQMGTTAFITIETGYQNQRREAVARCRQMIIAY